jgi:hypothetical protein
MPYIHTLVTQLTGWTEHSEGSFKASVELVSRSVDSVTKQAMGQDLRTNFARLRGYALCPTKAVCDVGD